MQSGESLIGKSIIGLNDGRILGAVKEFYLDRNLDLITGIQLSGGGFLGRGEDERKSKIVTRGQVAIFGLDAILVRDSNEVIDSRESSQEGWLLRPTLKGRAVDTPGGTKIGTIGDIIFDLEGRIVGFKLTNIFVKGPVAEKQVIAREVVVSTGNEDGVMTIDLSKAEVQSLAISQVGQ